MKQILIVKTGRTHDAIRERFGCFEDWMVAALDVPPDAARTVNVTEGDALPDDLDDVAGIVITGSPAMVTERHGWSESTARWLRARIDESGAEVPMVGICYGHQLLAHALGGRVDWNPRGREIGTVRLDATASLAGDPLLGGLDFPLDAHVTHLQSVVELPRGAIRLAASEREPHHAFRVGSNVWGLQFHPEFDEAIMRAYVDALADRMANEGIDAQAVRDSIRPATVAWTVLARFAAIARVAA